MTWPLILAAGIAFICAGLLLRMRHRYCGLARDYLALDELRDKEIKALKASNQRLVSVNADHASRLIRIVNLETPKAAAAAKRMAKIARGEG